MEVLYNLPSHDCIDKSNKIKILAAPPRVQDINVLDIDLPKEICLNKGHKEVKIGMTPERTTLIGYSLQAQCSCP